jgi:tetratricopeptide (TPR) repeat protein
MAIQESLQLGVAHHQAGRLEEARQLYEQVVAEQPDNANAIELLGILASQAGRHDQAVELIRRAVGLNPGVAHYHDNLGMALTAAGQPDQAIVSHRRAIALKPEFAAAHLHLANALNAGGRLTEAVAAFRRAVRCQPTCVDAHYNLGRCLFSQDRFAESEAAYRSALAVQPDHADALNNLGACLCAQGRLEEGMAMYRQALAIRPDFPDALNNLGNACRANGKLEEAKAYFQRTIAQQPDHALAHWNHGLALLSQGQYERGWPEYEWRWRVKDFKLRRDLNLPLWDGGELGGRTILIYAEQGVGDAMQFVRYLPEVARRGGKIVLLCHVQTHRLFAGLGGVAQLVGLDAPPPPYDVQCPLISLPRLMGTTLANIPNRVPYLKAPAALVEQWRARLPDDRRPRVGLCWANRPNPPDRCPEPDEWAPLAELNNVCFHGLQKPIAGDALPPLPPGLQVWDGSSNLGDFADTAALIANMDLVVSVDTAVAHLAGAMGKPVWVPLKFVPDWRWLLGRNDSPWYPTMRLFRQPSLVDWHTPVGQIAAALKALSRK